MNDLLIFEVADERGTLTLGESLAAVLPSSCVIALMGSLGAGKTRLVQAVARAAGVEEGVVASPTFVLVHEYAGRVPIFHFDAYRLRGADEFLRLALRNILPAKAGALWNGATAWQGPCRLSDWKLPSTRSAQLPGGLQFARGAIATKAQ